MGKEFFKRSFDIQGVGVDERRCFNYGMSWQTRCNSLTGNVREDSISTLPLKMHYEGANLG